MATPDTGTGEEESSRVAVGEGWAQGALLDVDNGVMGAELQPPRMDGSDLHSPAAPPRSQSTGHQCHRQTPWGGDTPSLPP